MRPQVAVSSHLPSPVCAAASAPSYGDPDDIDPDSWDDDDDPDEEDDDEDDDEDEEDDEPEWYVA